MLKTVLIILAIYILLSIIVSGCALIGEYAEGLAATPRGTAHTVPSSEGETDGKQSKSIGKRDKPYGKIQTSAGASDTKRDNPITVSVSLVAKRFKSKCEAAHCGQLYNLHKAMPRDLTELVLCELQKRKNKKHPKMGGKTEE